ncbi:3-hydroxyacyl-CoA dehydrogenase NAD-binding domain-containing protein [Parvularcula marina]|uniref:3-hydroxyacyl-CoA dehydrogenase n=1 Tax=Parvularcula marina TaxID=2292771 RepID=A0A371RM76_9PROT|nr:3-hydroxyacyl-CoA dehydrogenase NAD-binding domain-containing protein [Parvularcula marina]RFB06486.1 3-hydroxyacyl-CoA dehydrogenase [Parvularcula marina]
MPSVTRTTEGKIAVLTMNAPPVNALGTDLRAGIGEEFALALNDPEISAIVLTGSDRAFSAGADVREFGTDKAVAEPRLKTLESMIEGANKPVVAAISGVALGGGLELALSCHARVAAPTARLGLPEVNLGLLPGAGGTVRLPRLVGAIRAAEIIIAGKPLPAAAAHEAGIADEIAEDPVAAAVTLATELAIKGKPTPVIEREDKIADFDTDAFEAARPGLLKKSRGALAPARIADCVFAACTRPPQEALAFEEEAFKELVTGSQHRALKHVFFAERQARKVPGVPDPKEAAEIASVGIIGSGLMGGGIAMVFANAGIPVTIIDVAEDSLAKGRRMIETNYQRSVDRGSIPQEKMDRSLYLITGTTDYEGLGETDLVIEAVFENMELKQDIFGRLDQVTRPEAILASNTSSLDIDQIASATSRPEKVIGAHFFSPANVMKLLEVVKGTKTSPETIGAIFAIAQRIAKVPVLAGNCDGFIGNRMLQYYTAEAEYLLEEGATPEQVDRVAEGFGMAMGPLAMRDLSGMDTSIRIREIRRKTMPADERMAEVVERLVEAGRIGQKSGKGYYRYEGRKRIPDPETTRIIEELSASLGIERREIPDEEVRDRLFMPLVNEGAKELEEGIALRAGDIDTVWVNGYGFPAHRGGPMFWGQEVGLDRVAATAERLAEKNGQRWAPSQLMVRLATEGKSWDQA